MLKKSIYPKTKRVACKGNKIVITEKLDGANLCFFKYNDAVYISQRRFVYSLYEIDSKEVKAIIYKGLREWIEVNKDVLLNLNEGSVICGEWLGMGGRIKYTKENGFDKDFYMYAKANINGILELYNLKYDHELFIYSFKDEVIPDCIGLVPIVSIKRSFAPNKDNLDKLYEEYVDKVNRKVEGFVINDNNRISKYVRYKKGKLTEHFDRENE